MTMFAQIGKCKLDPASSAALLVLHVGSSYPNPQIGAPVLSTTAKPEVAMCY